jgi:hypothetical protein
MCFDYELPEKLKQKNKKLEEENMETQPELEKVQEQPIVTTA